MTTPSSYLSQFVDLDDSQTDQVKLHDGHLAEALDYILDSHSGSVKREKLAGYLRRRALKHSNTMSFDQIEALPRPDVPAIPDFRCNYTFDELLGIAEKYTENRRSDLARVMRYALIMCGIRIGDIAGLSSVRLDEGYQVGQRFPRVTGSVNQKRLSMRVAPTNSWGGSDAPLWTPFVLRGENGKHLSIGDHDIFEVSMLFLSDSIHNIAYFTKSGNQYFVTANPLQNCSHDCTFCCRSYGNMLPTYKSHLINLAPGEMARYLRVVFPKLDFYNVAEIAFITGVFPNDEYLLNYIELFLDEMRIVTGGHFDPCKHSHQRMKVSSHLLRSEEAMRTALALGVKRFTYTVELVDSYQRAFQMDLAKPGGRRAGASAGQPLQEVTVPHNQQTPFSSPHTIPAKEVRVTVKGTTTFDSVMHILETACHVFGQHEVEPVLIVGLDTYDDTIQAAERLHREGYRILTRQLLNAYGSDQMPLYRMALPEAIAVSEFINQRFVSAYQPVIDLNDQNVTRYNPLV